MIRQAFHRRQPRDWVLIAALIIGGEAAIWFVLKVLQPACYRLILYIAQILGKWPL